MKNQISNAIYILLFTLGCSVNGSHEPEQSFSESDVDTSISLKLIAQDLEAPVGMAVSNDGTHRLFIVEQLGTIRIIKNGQLLQTPFLDIRKKTDHGNIFYSEKGLLGLVFHPLYKSNGKFYVYYSATSNTKGMNHKSRVEEYTVSMPADDVAIASSRIILDIEEPESNHNGGQLAFGPDGYLYIGSGDGGGANDEHGTTGNGQNTKILLGKILRIDVNTASGYKIPVDNPFVKTLSRPEIFAFGLRNPWRFSFDRKSGMLFCADVGQDKWEEIDIIEKGKNYGWRIMEGNHCFNPESNCNKAGLVKPIAEYDHRVGKSITGGYVYRGAKYPKMSGKYLFGDWTGTFFILSQNGNIWKRQTLHIKNLADDFYINSFGEDENGELYVLGQGSIGPKKAGKIYQLVLE